jgi:hypothetical protein
VSGRVEMKSIRRITDDGAGFIKDVSEIIAIEAWKDPSLIPDLSKDKTIFIFSDYSRAEEHYQTYSFYVFGRSGADYFNAVRKLLREDFRLGRRRISFKQLNDKIKLKALSAFLEIAGAIDGFVLTFAVDNRIKYMFAEQFIRVAPELFSSVKKRVVEDMLRVVHFGAQAIMLAFSTGQNIVWFTDSDQIVANEKYEQLFGRIAEATIRTKFLPDEKVGHIGFGLTSVDDGSLEIEDFAAVPDLVAGALCETLSKLAQSGHRITPKIVLNRPHVSKKTNLICEWISKHQCPLKKFGVVFDKTGTNAEDWRPIFFHIKNLNSVAEQTCCGGQCAASYISDPIRFDIFETSAKSIVQ